MKRIIWGVLLLMVISVVNAEPTDEPHAEAVLKYLVNKYPKTIFKSVMNTPIKGVFEVVAGKNIFYTNSTGDYLFFGDIYDMTSGEDITADKRNRLNAIDIAKLPVDDAIVTVKGKGTHKLFLFSDPDCPYCKRAEQTINQFNGDLTLYTFMIPYTTSHPNAAVVAEAIWCAKDRAATWREYMLHGTYPPKASCENPIQRNLRMAEALRVAGTPTFIDEHGALLPAAPSLEELSRMTGEKQ